MPSHFDRIAVVGTSCAGKTTLARTLAARLACPHVELDALHWGPHWTPTPEEAFRSLVERAVSDSRWVCDGNYGSVRELVWGRATAVVWLNYSFPRVMGRAVRRTVRRVVTGERIYAENRESFRLAFLSRDSILWWVLSTYRDRRRRYEQLFAAPDYSHLHRVEIRSVRAAREFVGSLDSQR